MNQLDSEDMKMSTNIGSRDCHDKYYRYKMPILSVKHKKNHTIITNSIDISRALKTQHCYMSKYFAIELGTQSMSSDTGISLRGVHSANMLTTVLNKFIEQFILCSSCHKPEIDYYKGRKKVIVCCRACGHKSTLNMSHKLSKFIITKLPEVPEENSMPVSETDLPNDEEVVWFSDTSAEAVKARLEEM